MKKTFSRAFSLLLVLALLVSVIPSALAADGKLDVKAKESTIASEGSTTVTATAPEGADLTGATWVWSATEGATVSGTGTSATVTASAVTEDKEVTITATATVPAKEAIGDTPATEEKIYTGECKITVKAPVHAETIQLNYSSISPRLDEAGVRITATVTPNDATDEITWSVTDGSPDNSVVTIAPTSGTSTTVTAVKPGRAKVTATVNGKTASCNVTVEKKDITPTAPTVESLYVGGKTDPLTPGGLPTDKNDYTVTWAVESGDDKVSVTADGVVTALKAGPATLKATVALTETGAVKYNLTKTEIEVPVTVKNSGVVAEDISVKAGETGTITLSLSDKSATNVRYTVTSTSDSPSYTQSGEGNKIITFTTTKTTEDVYTFKVEATYDTATQKGVKAEGSVNAYVYRDDNEIYMTVTGSFASNSLTNVSSISKNSGKEYTNVTLNEMLQQTGAVEVKIGTGNGDKIGDFKEDHWILGADSVSFAVTTTGERYYSYELLTRTGLTVSKGYINIKAVNTTADIQYSTTYNKSITFDSSKFTTFWNNNKKANDFTSSLSYVTFDVSGGVYPQYGKLTYNNNTFSYATKFYTSSSQTYYLDKVTYVPDSTLKSSYYVTIPFTAYGTKTSEKMSGTVKIALNESDFLISSNGVQFGLGTTSVVDLMKEAYKAATGAELAYATFPNLSVSTGKLFYNYSTVLNNTPVVSSYEFYVKPTTSQKDLDKVVLVPRAGLTGKISFSFYGYDSQGHHK